MLDLVCRCKSFEALSNTFVVVLAGEGGEKSMNKLNRWTRKKKTHQKTKKFWGKQNTDTSFDTIFKAIISFTWNLYSCPHFQSYLHTPLQSLVTVLQILQLTISTINQIDPILPWQLYKVEQQKIVFLLFFSLIYDNMIRLYVNKIFLFLLENTVHVFPN